MWTKPSRKNSPDSRTAGQPDSRTAGQPDSRTAQTTREKFEEMIFQRGVFENQAKAIMDYAIPLVNAKYKHMEIAHKIDWNGRADGYPDPFYSLTFEMEIKHLVVLWIDENIPQAWFRAMFL